ncbi:hypothetical protein RJP56_07100 [Shewanella baltica]|uniref:hypothetical protein n=1 Tax=Shewanella baltica TaxID=62322 RepID=UPI002870C62E|nr:hypothetical protein [Shewanella baltica]MDR9765821.1 hypothetical protein [Shewanella baltica]
MDKNEDAYKKKKKVEQWLQDINIDFSIITPGLKGNSGQQTEAFFELQKPRR